MPYIKESDKKRLAPLVEAIKQSPVQNAGELNYIFTVLAQSYFARADRRNYQAINDIVGALDGAKVEFQRRVVGPYEDLKIMQNGDVFDEALISLLRDANPKRY